VLRPHWVSGCQLLTVGDWTNAFKCLNGCRSCMWCQYRRSSHASIHVMGCAFREGWECLLGIWGHWGSLLFLQVLVLAHPSYSGQTPINRLLLWHKVTPFELVMSFSYAVDCISCMCRARAVAMSCRISHWRWIWKVNFRPSEVRNPLNDFVEN